MQVNKGVMIDAVDEDIKEAIEELLMNAVIIQDTGLLPQKSGKLQ